MWKILTYTGVFILTEFILFYSIYLHTDNILESLITMFVITAVVIGFTLIGKYAVNSINNDDYERRDYD